MAFLATEALRRLKEADAAGRLAHAYLISGNESSGARKLVEELAALVLSVPAATALAHPDAHVVQPESKSRRIVIEQMRDLQRSIYQRAVHGSRKVAVIFEADRLQPQAANAFLKTLEEPPAGAHLLLVSSQPEMLLDTILSRCIAVPLRAEVAPPASESERRVIDALTKVAPRLQGGSLADLLGFVRTFQSVLQETRTRIREEFEAAFDDEKAQWKNTADEGWLRDREDQMKARSEAAAGRERARLVQAVSSAYAAALRLRETGEPPAAAYAEVARQLCAALTARQLLDRIASIDQMASALERNVNEPLALESGFLDVFSPDSQ